MSHIVTAKTKFVDRTVFAKACAALDVPCRVAPRGELLKEKVYTRTVEGIASAKLRGWQYPVVVGEDGESTYDNSNGGWGDITEFDKLKCGYAEQAARECQFAQGYQLSEDNQMEGYRELVFVR